MRASWLRWSALGLLVLLLALGGFAGWVLGSEAGARWALGTAQRMLAPRFTAAMPAGTLAGALRLADIHWHDPASGIDLTIAHAEFDLDAFALLRVRLHARRIALDGLVLRLEPPTRPPPAQPFSLQPPLDMIIDDLQLRGARLERNGADLVDVRSASFSGAWTSVALVVKSLDVVARQGDVHFSAALAAVPGARYVGKGTGRFRWRLGQQDWSGSVDADADAAVTHVSIATRAPINATLRADLRQVESLPFDFTLELPGFDPRAAGWIARDAAVRRIAATVAGHGDRSRVAASGHVFVNDADYAIEALEVERRNDGAALDARVRQRGGTLRAHGDLFLVRDPLAGDLAVNWQGVELPADLAGQVLQTAGALHLRGSLDRYAADGALTIGPPRRLAAVTLALTGSQRQLRFDRFDVVQDAGALAASGVVDLEPALSWGASARARRFDPGQLFAGWNGNLDFALQSSGRMLGAGPEATLSLTGLRGTLRNRKVAGSADLALASSGVLSGSLELRTGNSRLSLNGRRGATEDVTADVDIATLDDWLPGAQGRVKAHATARGRFPDLEGKVTLSAAQVAAAGFLFDSIDASVEGNRARHRIAFDARGKDFSAALVASGAAPLPGAQWRGSVQSLVIDARDVARLALQKPVELAWGAGSLQSTQACFADRDIRLCIEGGLEAGGALQAKYSLQNVPLALAASVLSPDFPLRVSGRVGGEGKVARSPTGELSGQAHLRSARGRVLLRLGAADGSQRRLLAYDDLAFDANLRGAAADARVHARLNDTGMLEGNVSAAGLGTATVALHGALKLQLPDLAVLELFVTQLAGVQGTAALQATLGGTLDEPTIGGELHVANFAAELPDIGVKLRDGRLDARSNGAVTGPIDIDGVVTSGGGTLALAGTAGLDGTAKLTARGKGVTLADMPGARVIADPDLAFERSGASMTLGGDVRLAAVDIDLERLPRGARAQAASPDVVVIDDRKANGPEMSVAQSRSVPLLVSLNLDYGDNVKIKGFGLDAAATGRLVVRERPGVATSGSGELRVAGTYKAYGQDLTIQGGQLLYAGTPLDNPRLNMVAARTIDSSTGGASVTAGLRITGDARSPQIAVFSDPAMGESNALSYLVAGKPIEDIGASSGDSAALQSAARSIGAAAGGLLAKNVGRRLGVDELGVRDSTALGGAALTIGQYLSPRLYLSYGVGLFEPGEVITLRYKLSRELSLEAENASRSSRAGIKYRVER
jgi:translocation and assembly module TamB